MADLEQQATSDGVYTSYDYGAAIRETGEIGTPSTRTTSPGPSTARIS